MGGCTSKGPVAGAPAQLSPPADDWGYATSSSASATEAGSDGGGGGGAADRQQRAVRFTDMPASGGGDYMGDETATDSQELTPRAARPAPGTVANLMCVDGLWGVLCNPFVNATNPNATKQQVPKAPTLSRAPSSRRMVDTYFTERKNSGNSRSGLIGSTPKPKPLDPSLRKLHKQLSDRNMLEKK